MRGIGKESWGAGLALLVAGVAASAGAEDLDESAGPPASTRGKSDPACLAPMSPQPGDVAEKLTLGSRAAVILGWRLTLASPPDADHRAVVGVLASVGEASPENLLLLDRYLEFFRSKGVEIVVVAGDIGEKDPDIEAVLRRLGASGLPVLAYAGNLEHRPEFVAALEAVHRDLPNVLSGHRVRELVWDDATLVTLPGHFDQRFLHRGRSCRYHAEDLDTIAAVVAKAPAPVILAAHSSPHGKAKTAIDVVDGENVGDVNLSRLLVDARIPFGIFPNIKEAGGVATADVDGRKVVRQNARSSTLYLNPGAADGAPWKMNDGRVSTGSAAVLTLDGGKASYTVFRAPRLTEAERRKLVGGE